MFKEPEPNKHNFGYCSRNQNIFFDILVAVNPEPEYKILVLVQA